MTAEGFLVLGLSHKDYGVADLQPRAGGRQEGRAVAQNHADPAALIGQAQFLWC